jgi:hypothetical protein
MQGFLTCMDLCNEHDEGHLNMYVGRNQMLQKNVIQDYANRIRAQNEILFETHSTFITLYYFCCTLHLKKVQYCE